MATSKQAPLSRSELAFWDRAFLGAEFVDRLKSKGGRLHPAGAAHLAGEYADAAVIERRLRRNGGAK